MKIFINVLQVRPRRWVSQSFSDKFITLAINHEPSPVLLNAPRFLSNLKPNQKHDGVQPVYLHFHFGVEKKLTEIVKRLSFHFYCLLNYDSHLHLKSHICWLDD